MKGIKRLVTTATLMAVIAIGVTSANASILMSDFTTGETKGADARPCIEKVERKDVKNTGVKAGFGLILEFTGTILDLVGVSVDIGEEHTNCGLILE